MNFRMVCSDVEIQQYTLYEYLYSRGTKIRQYSTSENEIFCLKEGNLQRKFPKLQKFLCFKEFVFFFFIFNHNSMKLICIKYIKKYVHGSCNGYLFYNRQFNWTWVCGAIRGLQLLSPIFQSFSPCLIDHWVSIKIMTLFPES